MIYPEIRALMGSEVIVKAEVSIDAFGKRGFVERNKSPYRCYPTFSNERRWSLEGREDVISMALYCDADDIEPNDQFWYENRQLKCVSIETWKNERNQVVGQVVYLQ
jgi:hypothetical protein